MKYFTTSNLLGLISFLKKWHTNLHTTKNNIKDLKENIQTMLLNQYDINTITLQKLIDTMKKLEHTKLWAQDIKTKISIGIFSLDVLPGWTTFSLVHILWRIETLIEIVSFSFHSFPVRFCQFSLQETVNPLCQLIVPASKHFTFTVGIQIPN